MSYATISFRILKLEDWEIGNIFNNSKISQFSSPKIFKLLFVLFEPAHLCFTDQFA